MKIDNLNTTRGI